MHLGCTILSAAAEAGIGENWCLLDNQSTCNSLINEKYLPNIKDAPDDQYICVHCSTVVTYNNKTGDLTGYSNPTWYNPKGIYKIPSLRLVHKHHLLTYIR